MSAAYVDTSAVVAAAFGEPGARALSRTLNDFSRLISSNLLEAELRATFTREGVEFGEQLLSSIDWILPDRPLSPEFNAILEVGYLRGADLWHLATALYVTEDPAQIVFMTLDNAQQAVASKLGFSAPTMVSEVNG